jgi:hypothetical protein
MVLVWGVWLCGFLLVLSAVVLLTLPRDDEVPRTGLEAFLLAGQFVLATAGSFRWWRMTIERRGLRYRRPHVTAFAQPVSSALAGAPRSVIVAAAISA